MEFFCLVWDKKSEAATGVTRIQLFDTILQFEEREIDFSSARS